MDLIPPKALSEEHVSSSEASKYFEGLTNFLIQKFVHDDFFVVEDPQRSPHFPEAQIVK